MKSDDALRLFSYHPAALHFRKGLGDRPFEVDRTERVGPKAAYSRSPYDEVKMRVEGYVCISATREYQSPY